MKSNYHEFAVSMARELFPELHYDTIHGGGGESIQTSKDKFAAKVDAIERNIWKLIAPLEAAANHDLTPNRSLETSIRNMHYQLTQCLERLDSLQENNGWTPLPR